MLPYDLKKIYVAEFELHTEYINLPDMNWGNVVQFLQCVRDFYLLQSGKTSCLCIGYRGRCLSR